MLCEMNDRNGQNIFFKRTRSRKKKTQKMANLFKDYSSVTKMTVIWILMLSFSGR